MKIKITVRILPLVCLALLLSACNTEESTNKNEDSELTVVANQEEESETPVETKKEEKEVSSPVEVSHEEENKPNTKEEISKEYEMVKETYSEGSVNVDYPQITNLQDEEKQKELNELIKKEALRPYLDTLASLEPDQTYEAEGNYEIKLKDEEMLSIAYTSYNNITPSAHPYHLFHTTNLDLTKGRLLYLTDFVKEINSTFVQLLKEAAYVGDLGSEYEDEVRDMAFGSYGSDEELIAALQDSEVIYVYVTKDTLGISMPVAHVAGGHAEFEIDYSELVDAGLIEKE